MIKMSMPGSEEDLQDFFQSTTEDAAADYDGEDEEEGVNDAGDRTRVLMDDHYAALGLSRSPQGADLATEEEPMAMPVTAAAMAEALRVRGLGSAEVTAAVRATKSQNTAAAAASVDTATSLFFLGLLDEKEGEEAGADSEIAP